MQKTPILWNRGFLIIIQFQLESTWSFFLVVFKLQALLVILIKALAGADAQFSLIHLFSNHGENFMV